MTGRFFEVYVGILSEDKERMRELKVTGTLMPVYPAVPYMKNGDPGNPAEGGEIEDMRVYLLRSNREREVRLPTDVDDEIDEAVREELEEQCRTE